MTKTNTILADSILATLTDNAAKEMALFLDPSVDATSIKVANTQDVGEMVGSISTATARIAQWCVKHLKGFPLNVSKADKAALKAGILRHKLALDATTGKYVAAVVKIGEDRYMPQDKWLAGPGKDAEVDSATIVDVSGKAIMALNGNKVGKWPKGTGTLHSFVAPRKKAIQTYVSNRYADFINEAIRLQAHEGEETLLAKGKEVTDTRPVVPREVRVARAFFAVGKAVGDGEFYTVTQPVFDAAVAKFWTEIGVPAPTLDVKGNWVEEDDAVRNTNNKKKRA